jgi:DNA polymerase
MWAGEALKASGGTVVMILGEAPGAVEQERGKPFVGQSGELLHSMLKECGLTSYYVSNIAKHQPYKDKHGKQQAPSKTEIEACAPFLRAEFNLVEPRKLILLGKTAAKLVVDGNFSMGKVVNQDYEFYGPKPCSPYVKGIPTLILYHPAYFLRQRTAPWIQKAIRDWKSAVRLFLGAKAPTYQVERVRCETHG